ncbi:MAG: enoyl-CoA hydratase/isomerase family protein [Acidobacteria bacterium]|nr:enoyl-CoA hydratase/isomerase family protein [Acidobacteriota bacterium]
MAINRPDKRNALNVTVMRELREAFALAKADPDVRVAVLTGAGEKAFCAGGDLGGFSQEESRVQHHLLRGTLTDLLEEMTRLGKPIVARVNGHALAGGFGLVCGCDLAIATETAEFGMPEINMGLWPFIITAVVGRAMPARKALEMMMTGERISAAEAERLGVILRAVPAGELDKAVDDLAEKLSSKSPLIMRLGKDSFYRSRDMGLREALDYLHGQLAVCLESEDTVEGVAAFLQKRAPEWKGR